VPFFGPRNIFLHRSARALDLRIKITPAHPASLTGLRGAVISPLPFPALREAKYKPLVFDGTVFAIASRRRCRSVYLKTKKKLSFYRGRIPVFRVTTESLMSRRLLRILMRHLHGLNYEEKMLGRGSMKTTDGVLLIGDHALKEERRLRHIFPLHFDLGELWHRLTGLHCVFAVWACSVGVRPHLRTLSARLLHGAFQTFGREGPSSPYLNLFDFQIPLETLKIFSEKFYELS